ncbi:MAG: Gfo/Idh/MocA family protein [Armatimonadota bacterium]
MVRVGVVGLGRVSEQHIEGFQRAEGAQVTALCDCDEAKLRRAVVRFGLAHAYATTSYTELLARDEVDAVSLAVPDYLHHPYTLQAVQAGKHVLCEKPLAMNAVQAREMAAAVADAGLVNAVHLQLRELPAVRYIRDLVRDGFLGTVRHFRCRMSVHRLADPTLPLEWRHEADKCCYGVLGDLGAHALDLARFMLGEVADTITGAGAIGAIFVARRPLPDGSGTAEVTAMDAVNFSVRYSGQVLGQFQLSRFSPGIQGFEIDGQDASVRWWPHTPQGCIEVYEREPLDDQAPASVWTATRVPTRYPQAPSVFDNFARAIREGGSVSPSFEDGLAVARQLDMIHEVAFVAMHHEPEVG